MTSDLILGIDGGGSKVFVVLADRTGRIVRAAAAAASTIRWTPEPGAAGPTVLCTTGLAGIAAARRPTVKSSISQSQREAIAQTAGISQTVLNDADAAYLARSPAVPEFSSFRHWLNGMGARRRRKVISRGRLGRRNGSEGPLPSSRAPLR